MTAPDPTAPAATATPPEETQPPADPTPGDEQQPTTDPAPEADKDEQEALPDWVRKKLDKVQREAQNLRSRLKDQEPLVAAAQEAERKNMSDLDRQKAENADLQQLLAQRDTELLAARYQLTDEDIEFIGEGSFEEKEARAKKFAARVQSASTPVEDDPAKPPTRRPVESLKPGASPTPPPAVDNSYPAHWVTPKAQ
ncbi:hypothetical protein [Gordonia sp. (in: high G+C Gram-positive bacteria)]|uniref:hypothetical protein n=1 Tax=Gordonia sp. (in: high G+C Gram-positive bacteria) TaxID=84139 RepID=UPI0039E2545C